MGGFLAPRFGVFVKQMTEDRTGLQEGLFVARRRSVPADGDGYSGPCTG